MSQKPFPRLRLALILPTLAALAAAGPLLWVLLSGLLEASVAGRLLDLLPALAPAFAERADGEPDEVQDWVRGLAAESSLRLTLIAENGAVLADSERTGEQVARMDNHAGRPEVRQAVSEGAGSSIRRSATTGLAYVYAARPFTSRDGRRYVLRIAEPLTELSALRRELARSLLAVSAVALLAMALVSWWLRRRLAPPFAALAEGIGQLAEGRFEHRVRAERGDPAFASLAGSLNRLAERAEGQIAALDAERAHVEAVVQSMTEGVAVTDETGAARLVNPAFRRLFELTGPVVGRSLLELTHESRFEQLVRGALATDESQVAELEIDSVPRRSLVLAASALSDGSGAVVVARDVTDLLRVHRMRRDFVANVSHELKTPLTAIRGSAETLLDGAVSKSEVAERFLERILQQCRRLQALLDDLLTLSRLESPEATEERSQVDLARLLRQQIEALQPLLEAREIDCRLDAPAACLLPGDAEALERMVRNLLENAARYNRHGGRVGVRLACGGDEIVLEVEDTGIGIPPEARERVFERFYRVDQARAREEGGTGLGLAIVKHAAQLHGGRVEIRSRLGEGSLFRVILRPAGD